MKTKLSLILVLLQCMVFAQSGNKNLKEGNKLYERENYDEAEIRYRKAFEAEKEDPVKAQFNLGDALYKQERYEEATEQFSAAAAQTDLPEVKAKALHNLGNSLNQQEKYKEAIEAYKNSLKINPQDDETRYNLARTLKQLQQQQQQKQQNQDQDKDENKEEKDQPEQPENKDEEEKPGDPKDKEGQPDKPDDQKESGEKPKPRPDRISREDAERLLNSLDKEERGLQKKINEEKIKGKPATTEKDW